MCAKNLGAVAILIVISQYEQEDIKGKIMSKTIMNWKLCFLLLKQSN